MKRRDILATALGGSAATTIGAAVAGPGVGPKANDRADDEASHEANTRRLLGSPTTERRSLVNQPWARDVLAREGIDGVVALQPVNVFYLSNYTSFFDRMGVPYASFAVLPCDAKRDRLLVTSSADAWAISNNERDYPSTIFYSQPQQWEPYLDQQHWAEPPPATGEFGSIWPRQADSLSAREQHWLQFDQRLRDSLTASSVYALARALREAGLEKGRIAVDDMRIAGILGAVGFDRATFVEGDNIMRKIRVVKSAVEVNHMRSIAMVNQAASVATMRQLSAGATAADIDQIFSLETAKRGATPMWLVTGGVGGLRSRELVEGEPVLFDAVSQINNYHGDFGRTLVLGEPSRKLQQRAQLIQAGWHAAFETLRPGVRYSQVRRAARAAMKKTGLPEARIGVTPHSVGLQHTDEPYRDGLPFTIKDDLVLRENMTLTVDFPSMELGWGSCHLEDLVRITRDGAEPLATMDSPLVVV